MDKDRRSFRLEDDYNPQWDHVRHGVDPKYVVSIPGRTTSSSCQVRIRLDPALYSGSWPGGAGRELQGAEFETQ